MSVYFPTGADTFLAAVLDTPLSVKYPVTLGGFVKYKVDVGTVKTAGIGNTEGNFQALQRLSANDNEYKTVTSGVNGIVKDTVNVVDDKWMYLAFTRTSSSSGYLYIKDEDGNKQYLHDTTETGAWTDDEIQKVLFGSVDFNLNGGLDSQEHLLLSTWGLWENQSLSENSLDLLAAGRLPDTVGTVKHYWFEEFNKTLLGEMLLDSINNNDLLIRTTTDGHAGSGTIDPIYSADIPVIDEPVHITFDVVIDFDDTPAPDATGVSYKVSTGTRSSNAVEIYSGDDGIIRDGKISILTPDSASGDTLIISGDVTDTNIYNESALHLRGVGSVTVVGVVPTIWLQFSGSQYLEII